MSERGRERGRARLREKERRERERNEREEKRGPRYRHSRAHMRTTNTRSVLWSSSIAGVTSAI